MKIKQLIDELKSYSAEPLDDRYTCDTVKVGDPSIPATAEITANPMKMYYNIDTIEPRWK